MTLTAATIESIAREHGLSVAQVRRIAVEEGFLRRAALVKGPFMLKGSYVTRQLLRDGWRRIPGDLDWVGLGPLDAEELTAWVTQVTETELDDGIRFRSFSENPFWRMIEYAMDDDFPSVNTDLMAWVAEEACVISAMDVSYGLRLEPPPRALTYQPQHGAGFVLPLSCALELQLAWKLHQCLVRPRFKDILDLILLLRENSVDAAVIWQTLEAECRHDGTPLARFNWLLDTSLAGRPVWPGMQDVERAAAIQREVAMQFSAWRHGPAIEVGVFGYQAALVQMYIGGSGLPLNLADFLDALASQLAAAGFMPATQDEARPARAEPLSPAPGLPGIGAALGRWLGLKK